MSRLGDIEFAEDGSISFPPQPSRQPASVDDDEDNFSDDRGDDEEDFRPPKRTLNPSQDGVSPPVQLEKQGFSPKKGSGSSSFGGGPREDFFIFSFLFALTK